jgi:ABC-type sugar transport system substrate-binding protein
MALGAIQAIRAFGLTPGEDIIIIGIDAVRLAFEAIIAGDMNATIECSPLLGPQFVEAIKMLERGETLEKVTFSNWTDFDDFLYQIYPDRFSSARVHVGERVY